MNQGDDGQENGPVTGNIYRLNTWPSPSQHCPLNLVDCYSSEKPIELTGFLAVTLAKI